MGGKVWAAALLAEVFVLGPTAVEAASAFSVPAGPNWLVLGPQLMLDEWF
jgi:hypothetical protein